MVERKKHKKTRKTTAAKNSQSNSKKTAKKSRAQKKKISLKWRITKILLVCLLWAGIFGGLVLLYYGHDLPDTDSLNQQGKVPTIKVVSRDGNILAKIAGERGSNLKFSEFPKSLVDAVIATEDRRFFDHFGIDMIGIMRAMYTNIEAGYVKQGGSSITQQLAKISFLSHQRTLKRKIQEVMLALWLERHFTKEEILAMYLNRAYFGAGAFGVDSAAWTYFNKPAKELSVSESAMIAGLLKAPTTYCPFTNPQKAQQRMHQVLANMVDAGFISTTDALAKVRTIKTKPEKITNKARYFVNWVVGQVPNYIRVLDEEITVFTTLDLQYQERAEQAVRLFLGDKPQQAGVVLSDYNGQILAMVGGKSYRQSQYNRATQALRQPGSAFKLFVYLAALENHYTPETVVSDSPIIVGDWTPHNYSENYRGMVSLQSAFKDSINTVAVRISEKIGRENVIEMAHRFGIASDVSSHPSIALGTSEVHVLEMTNAYTQIANGGYATEPTGILEIRNNKGEVLYQHDDISRSPRVVTENVAAQMHKMLVAAVEEGTGKAAKFRHASSAGKTGTSQDYRDAWFVGYSPSIVAGIWVGNDDSSPMVDVSGGTIPARLFSKIMQEIHPDDQTESFYTPPKVKPVLPRRKNEDFWRRISGQ